MKINKKCIKIARRIAEGLHVDGVQVNVINGNVERLSLQGDDLCNDDNYVSNRFPDNANWRQGEDLYQLLTDGNYIASGTTLANFLWVMGYSTLKPNQIAPIMWLKTKMQLRVMLDGALAKQIGSGQLKVVDMERLVPKCFVGKDGQPYSLTKPKEEYSADMDRLKEFFDAKTED